MAMLGKCLVFHLKYGPEMQHLYWADQKPPLEGLDEAERVLRMVQEVGDAACRQAADFLEACATRVEERFRTFSTIRRHSKRATLERNWGLTSNVSMDHWPERGFQLGVMIGDDINAAVAWIWCRGGHRAEDALARILGSRAHSRAGEGLVSDSGTVALAAIPVLPEHHQGFDLDRDPLVNRVYEAFASISAADVEAMLAI